MGSSHDSARRSRPNVSGIGIYEVRKRLDSLKPRPCSPTIGRGLGATRAGDPSYMNPNLDN